MLHKVCPGVYTWCYIKSHIVGVQLLKLFQWAPLSPFIMASSADTKPFERKERARHTHTQKKY